MMRAGGSDFHGTLSLLQLWNDVRDLTDEIIPILNAKTGPVKGTTYTEHLVADWSWGSLQPGPGVLRLSHSQRGHTVCDPGQQHISQDNDTCIPQTTGAVMFQHLRTLDKVVPVDLCRKVCMYIECVCLV